MASRNPCLRCLMKTLGWFPIVMITAILIWSYYAYIYELCIKTVHPVAVQALLIILFHVLYLLLFVSFYRTVFAPLGHPPQQFHIPENRWLEYNQAATDDYKRKILHDLTFERSLPIHTRQHDNSIRVCMTCRVIKPDRAHHCSICERCNLKMDHHCPWVNTCVNFMNYKFFILFLGYATIFTLFVILSVIKYAIDVWKEGLNDNGVEISVRKINIVLLPFIALVFCGSAAALFFYHIWLLAKNQTTIEQGRAPIFDNGHVRNDGFSIGHIANVRQVMGPSVCLWLLPIHNSIGDGIVFPSRYINSSRSEHYFDPEQLQQQNGGHAHVIGNGSASGHELNGVANSTNRVEDVHFSIKDESKISPL